MKEYYNLLKDPRWWRKRKYILKRDGNKCTVCGSKKKLKVHHTFYYNEDTSPWLYPNNSLITLCDICHTKYHETNEIIIKEKPKEKRYVPIIKNLSLLNCYELEYVSRKGKVVWCQTYAKSEADALYEKKKKIKQIIRIKRIRNIHKNKGNYGNNE